MHLYTKNKNTYLRMGTSIEEQKVLSGADPFDVYNHNNIHKVKWNKTSTSSNI